MRRDNGKPAKAEKMATPKVKDTKKEAMRKAAESSMSILDWIKPKLKQDEEEVMDWSNDKSIPSGESIITIERKEAARMRKEAWMTRRLCQEEIGQILDRGEQEEDL